MVPVSRGSISTLRSPMLNVAMALAIIVVLLVAPGQSQTYTVLYAFKGAPDGQTPLAGVALDKSGNIYGTTYEAGTSKNCTGGCGIVFKLTNLGRESVLHDFRGR